jgi:hypothetical protein
MIILTPIFNFFEKIVTKVFRKLIVSSLKYFLYLIRQKIISCTINDVKIVDETLRVNDLRQALYDAGATLKDKVLVNLQGKEHQISRKVVAK